MSKYSTLLLLPENMTIAGKIKYAGNDYDETCLDILDFESVPNLAGYDVVLFSDPERETDHVLMERVDDIYVFTGGSNKSID